RLPGGREVLPAPKVRAGRPGRRRDRRAAAGMTAVVCAAVVAALVPGPVASAVGDDAADVPLSEGHKALQAAQQSGQRVEVTTERGERTRGVAPPDG
ncbi:hypothetical protein, partial [Streptomyces sp. NPDC058964]|uniref:hypothetical protein n=1 Tax=Streptomyces sp. NPDC058964 TaxID=3346681 RepID=UPI0036CD4D2A